MTGHPLARHVHAGLVMPRRHHRMLRGGRAGQAADNSHDGRRRQREHDDDHGQMPATHSYDQYTTPTTTGARASDAATTARGVVGCLRRSLLIGRLHLRDLGQKQWVPPRYT